MLSKSILSFPNVLPERLYQVALVVIIPVESVSAYLDPGTGSIIIQSILAVALGAAFYFRTFMASTKRFFSKAIKKQERDEKKADNDTDPTS